MELPVFRFNPSTKRYETDNPGLYIEIKEQGDNLFHFTLFWVGRSLLFVVERQARNKNEVIWFFRSIGDEQSKDVFKFESAMEIFIATEMMKSFMETYKTEEKNQLHFSATVQDQIIKYVISEHSDKPPFQHQVLNFIQVENSKTQTKSIAKTDFWFNRLLWVYELDSGNIRVISVPGRITSTIYKISWGTRDTAVIARRKSTSYDEGGNDKEISWVICGLGGDDLYGRSYGFKNDFEIYLAISVLIFFFKNYFPPLQDYTIDKKKIEIADYILEKLISHLLNIE